ncbi:flagellar hook protein FlgE [Pseudomonas benzenivorans]|uniref:Flagellar hook protein FlgE n=1 Tax=Pseudomonas benzenivorans TaxID=556533 RepID=A0ABY5H4R0_9PSED|nr:flagellar hook protein FlgE [Pseudomonas benzenivorans]UTW07287.1 flagellar hook protein FlgE [Pseudomonas benzenivorans]
MAFNIGLSGLRAATSDLNVTGNNIANAGTAGFKQSRAEFADVYAASVQGSGSNPTGSGVLLGGVSQLFKQGNVNYTQNPLDLAINGNGFFRTSNNGEISYTRAGYFGTDREGYIENNFHHRLQGYPVDANGNLQSGVVSDLRVDSASQSPRATAAMRQQLNLNSSNKVPSSWQGAYDASIAGAADPTNPTPGELAGARAAANATFDPADPTTYNSSTSTNVYDTQGNAHVLTQYFVKTGANQWQMNVLIGGRNPADPTSTEPYSMSVGFTTSGQLDIASLASGDYDANGTADFAVDPATGRFTLNGWVPAAADNSNPPVWSPNGAVANTGGVEIDLRGTTQANNAFAVTSVSQDGYTTGQLAGLEIDDAGVIFARYTNGQSRIQGQVVLASFANMQGLTPVGKTAWAQSFQSGEPVIGTPRSGTLGALQSGALEDSNVELSDQLVNLIVAQRNYQANAKTIETESAVTQTIINLR